MRKATLLGLRDVLVTKGAEQFIEDAIVQLKFSINDRSIDVRQTFYSQVLPKWITEMEINSLKLYDAALVLFLLNGLSDESEEISRKCKEMLEEHGRQMREALI